jgi:hypothetical protein
VKRIGPDPLVLTSIAIQSDLAKIRSRPAFPSSIYQCIPPEGTPTNKCGCDEDGGWEPSVRQLFHSYRNSPSIRVVEGDRDTWSPPYNGRGENGVERDDITCLDELIELIGETLLGEV